MNNTTIGGSSVKSSFSDNYSKNPCRIWLNNNFIASIPNSFNKLIKTVIKKNLANHFFIDSSTNPTPTEDKAFLLSYPEVFGTQSYNFYIKNNPPSNYEGEQYEYYKNTFNRQKYANNNGVKGENSCEWWLRSPSTKSDASSTDDYSWITVENDGSCGYNGGEFPYTALCPSFCL